MGIHRSYFNKNNTLIKDNETNNSQNTVTEISYGSKGKNSKSRFIFNIDLDNLINNTDINVNNIISHKLHLINTIRYNEQYLGGNFTDQNIKRTNSFDLELFNINEEWDEGSGYEFVYNPEKFPQINTGVSNWINRISNNTWSNEGAYESGNTIIIGNQHFDKGSEDLEIDVTDYINNILYSGNTYNSKGLGIKFTDDLENLVTEYRQAVAFYARHTHTFFEPYIETIYNNKIYDDRFYFYQDKDNELYLYSKWGSKYNDTIINSVSIIDNNGVEIDVFTGDSIINVEKGVYKISLNISENDYPDSVIFRDVWNVKYNNITKDIIQSFYIIPSDEYYNFKFPTNNFILDNYHFRLNGIKENEKIISGNKRRIFIDIKQLYRTQNENKELDIDYRLYINVTDDVIMDVIPYTNVNRMGDMYYFDIDTSWLIAQDYNVEVRLNDGDVYDVKNKIKFTIVSN